MVLTNYATAEMREACRRLGADRIFDKSSELEELLAYCERLGRGAGQRARRSELKTPARRLLAQEAC